MINLACVDGKWQKNIFILSFTMLVQSVVLLDVSLEQGKNIEVTFASLKMELLIYIFSEMFKQQLVIYGIEVFGYTIHQRLKSAYGYGQKEYALFCF